MGLQGKSNIWSFAACALALVAVVAATAGCNSGDSATGKETNADTFTVVRAGDRLEINLGTPGPVSFHFEAKGFTNNFRPQEEGANEYIYFWLYNGDNFYFKGAGEGFLYLPIEYAYTDYYCNYGKVKGRSNTPDVWPLEECYIYEPWDPSKWYAFDIVWDGATITLTIDGVVRNVGHLDPNTRTLIAGMGWPPANFTEHPGIVGMEFRNWSFKKL